MNRETDEPAALIARALSRQSAAARGLFLRDLLAHAAAGLVVLEGERTASEAIYRLADAVVDRGAV